MDVSMVAPLTQTALTILSMKQYFVYIDRVE